MKYWIRPYQPVGRDEITCAIQDTKWQELRISLKGIPTEEKLDKLKLYLDLEPLQDLPPFTLSDREIQVINYINALKRSGLLNMNLEVIR